MPEIEVIAESFIGLYFIGKLSDGNKWKNIIESIHHYLTRLSHKKKKFNVCVEFIFSEVILVKILLFLISLGKRRIQKNIGAL